MNTTWAIAGGFMPLGSCGREPEFTSRDQLALLNIREQPAQVQIWCYFADRAPLGPYRFEVAGRRVRKVRYNDLIDPQALPLETRFASVVIADVPIVVQVTRLDSRQAALACMGTMAFPVRAPITSGAAATGTGARRR